MLGYDLHISALHHGQIKRLASHIAFKTKKAYEIVLDELQTSISIPIFDHNDLFIVEVQSSVEPLLISWLRKRLVFVVNVARKRVNAVVNVQTITTNGAAVVRRVAMALYGND